MDASYERKTRGWLLPTGSSRISLISSRQELGKCFDWLRLEAFICEVMYTVKRLQERQTYDRIPNSSLESDVVRPRGPSRPLTPDKHLLPTPKTCGSLCYVWLLQFWWRNVPWPAWIPKCGIRYSLLWTVLSGLTLESNPLALVRRRDFRESKTIRRLG